VGLHGDGIVRRTVLWPVQDASNTWIILPCEAASRRFWCPNCASVTTVAHLGVGDRTSFAHLAIALILRWITAPPLGSGIAAGTVFHRVRGRDLPGAERARPGRPRWRSIRRWADRLVTWWPQFVATSSWREVVRVFVAWILPSRDDTEWLEAAMDAHRRGGTAM
jgi:hypothetical protein